MQDRKLRFRKIFFFARTFFEAFSLLKSSTLLHGFACPSENGIKKVRMNRKAVAACSHERELMVNRNLR
jgi:hypothetical protein